MTSAHPPKKTLGIGLLVAAGVAPGVAWILLLLAESHVDDTTCGLGSHRGRREWFGGSTPLPLLVLAAAAIALTVGGGVVLFRSWRAARRASGKIAETRATMALVSLVSICLFVPLVAATVVRVLSVDAC
ncbi:MAG TPA: hypothetical protein VH761_03510 [Ilumatobacteraceae bacterium]|jgi:hypothetical protein